MWTISYKGFWIHGSVANDECRVQAPDYAIVRICASRRAAERFIRNAIKKGA